MFLGKEYISSACAEPTFPLPHKQRLTRPRILSCLADNTVLGRFRALCGTEIRGSLCTPSPVNVLAVAGDTETSSCVSGLRDSSSTKDSLQLLVVSLSVCVACKFPCDILFLIWSFKKEQLSRPRWLYVVGSIS
jgi:hypothetical protein